MKKKFELGLFENPYVVEGKVLEVFETSEQRLALQIARQSMVLMKNDGLLPLQKTIKTLAVIGRIADDSRTQQADYSYAAMHQLMELKAPENSAFLDIDVKALGQHNIKITTVLDGIQAAVSQDTRILFARGCDNLSNDTAGFAEAVKMAQEADAVVLVLGDRWSRSGTPSGLTLPGASPRSSPSRGWW